MESQMGGKPNKQKVEVSSKDFETYKSVQMEGQYNMLMPQARELTGLDKKVYWAIIQNYKELNEQYGLEE